MEEALKRGDRVGDGGYKLMSRIGLGGFGEVWLADGGAGLVAVKAVETSHWSEKQYRVFNAMLVSEASFLSTLEHPGLPKLQAFFAEGTRYFLVMEWVKGETVEELVEREGPLPLEEVMTLVESLTEVMRYLHEQCQPTVVFGDIKPANILRVTDGSYRLVDLGLATRLGTQLTGTFAVFSPDYSAPERSQGEPSRIAHDVYAFAATLCYAITGQPPSAANDTGRAIRHALRAGAQDWGEQTRAAIASMYPIVMRCLSVESGARPANTRPLREGAQRWREAWDKENESENVSDILDSLYRGPKKPLL